MYSGIDVSNFNGNIDWDRTANDIDFAVIRIGWGSDYENQDDPEAERNMQECERLSKPYQVYLYSSALNVEDARSEAAHALRMIKNHSPQRVWIDMEDGDGYKERHGVNPYESRQLLTDVCRIFCSEVESAGYKAGVYANKNYWDNVLFRDQLTDYSVWLAHWNIDKPSMDCLMWQYTSDGSVSGIKGRVDMDYYYGELENTQGGNTQPEREYVVESGDSLWAIAERFYGDGSKYTVIASRNNIENPELIYAGHRLIIPDID